MKLKRDFLGMFDVMKGLLMLVVVLSHTNSFVGLVTGSSIGGYFRTYTVLPIALFFLIAGYSFRPEKDLPAYLRRQARDLLLPYLLMPVVCIPLRAVLYLALGRFSPDRLTRILWAFLYGATQPMELFGQAVDSVDAMWFLPTLFLAGLLHQLLHRLPGRILPSAAIWGIVIAAALFPPVSRLQVPWFLVQACTSLGMLEFGRLLKAYKVLHRPLPWWTLLPAALLLLFLHFHSGSSLWANVWTYGPVDYLGSVFLSVVLLQLYLRSGLAVAEWTQPLAYIGRYSLYFLCIHSAEMIILPWSDKMAAVLYWLPLPIPVVLFLLFAGRVLFAGVGTLLLDKGQRRIARQKRKKELSV